MPAVVWRLAAGTRRRQQPGADCKAAKLEKHKQDWRIGDTINASIGQGYVLASPLQLAVMTARLASGRAVSPRLVHMVDNELVPVPEAPLLPVDPTHLQSARRGMFEVMNGARGTAKSARIADDTMLMAGKTGTAQVRNISAAERASGVVSNDQLPWERRDHALFVCFAPYDRPKVAVSVVVEHGGGGSTVAAVVVGLRLDGSEDVHIEPPLVRRRWCLQKKQRSARDT